MDVDIAPEPPEGVRRAIVAALSAERRDADVSAWWRAGVEADCEDGPSAAQAGTRRRSSAGAERA
jgi:hypothetical protein